MRNILLTTGLSLLSSMLPTDVRAAGFMLAAPDFPDGGTIPSAQVFDAGGCTGGNHSPALSWSAEPPGTQSFAVTMFDPDAPTRHGWWHWTVFNIPAGVHGLPADAGAAHTTLLPVGAGEGRSDFGFSWYGGPCPPVGDPPHHYEITIYALKVAHLPLNAAVPGDMVAAMLRANALANALATARITGLYGRPH